jgi:hypothetical protein
MLAVIIVGREGISPATLSAARRATDVGIFYQRIKAAKTKTYIFLMRGLRIVRDTKSV